MRHASGEPLFDFPLSTEETEELSPVEELAHSAGRIDNPQGAVRGSRQVECLNQLPDAGGIDSRYPGQI
jgi:hypothetical protein